MAICGLALLACAWRGAFDDSYFAGKATGCYGGYITNYTLDGTNWTAHIFTNVGTTNFIVLGGTLDCEVLVVAGGGGGGQQGGGGGAGGVIVTNLKVSAGIYDVIVGKGGQPHAVSTATLTNGSNSVFGDLSAYGGGAGAPSDNAGNAGPNNGGSGGGSSPWPGLYEDHRSGGTGVVGQGHDGGYNYCTGPYMEDMGHSGGGGKGGVGGWSTNGIAGNGGIGITNAFSGETKGYAGGGGGGMRKLATRSTAQDGGGAGGDFVVVSSQIAGEAGEANTGGGGGGGPEGRLGGEGGSGIVIIRYQ